MLIPKLLLINGIAIGGDATTGDAALVSAANGVSIGKNTSTTHAQAVTMGLNAVSTAANCFQMGEATNSGTSATFRFRSQIIGNETWISAGTNLAAIDASGNIIKTATPATGGAATEIVSGGGWFHQTVQMRILLQPFVKTTSAGADMTGTLADGNSNGMIKYIVATSLLAKYTLTITSGVDAEGNVISSITFDNTGNSASLVWDADTANWFHPRIWCDNEISGVRPPHPKKDPKNHNLWKLNFFFFKIKVSKDGKH